MGDCVPVNSGWAAVLRPMLHPVRRSAETPSKQCTHQQATVSNSETIKINQLAVSNNNLGCKTAGQGGGKTSGGRGLFGVEGCSEISRRASERPTFAVQ